MKRYITCTNDSGHKIEFGHGYNPWLLTDVDGIYKAEADIYTIDNIYQDGSRFVGKKLKPRNITLSLQCRDDYREARQQLYSVFEPGRSGTFTHAEGQSIKVIDYYVESLNIDGKERLRNAFISLLCPSPFFTTESEIVVSNAGSKQFEFIHEFVNDEEIQVKREDGAIVVVNNTDCEFGMVIEFTTNQYTDERITLRKLTAQDTEYFYVFSPNGIREGEKVSINTHKGQHQVKLDSIYGSLDITREASGTFFQMTCGENVFFPDENLIETLTIAFKPIFLGA